MLADYELFYFGLVNINRKRLSASDFAYDKSITAVIEIDTQLLILRGIPQSLKKKKHLKNEMLAPCA